MSKQSFSKIFVTFFLLILMFLFANISHVNAQVTPPSFPSCLNPIGTLNGPPTTGVHGIPGNVETFLGSDSVFIIDKNTLIQCFCAADFSGIQTNWWKIPNLSANDIENFKTQGWVFIPDGRQWGLESVPYLAMNINFSCTLPSGNSGGPSSSGGSSSSGGGGGSGGGSSSGQSLGEILGLAFTGNVLFIYGLLTLGIIFLFTGLALKKLTSK